MKNALMKFTAALAANLPVLTADCIAVGPDHVDSCYYAYDGNDYAITRTTDDTGFDRYFVLVSAQTFDNGQPNDHSDVIHASIVDTFADAMQIVTDIQRIDAECTDSSVGEFAHQQAENGLDYEYVSNTDTVRVSRKGKYDDHVCDVQFENEQTSRVIISDQSAEMYGYMIVPIMRRARAVAIDYIG